MSCLAVTPLGPVTLNAGWDHGLNYDPPFLKLGNRKLDLNQAFESVFDVAVMDGRVAALYEAEGSGYRVALTTLALDKVESCKRVQGGGSATSLALTSNRVFVLRGDEVVPLGGAAVAKEALGIAGSPSRLAVIGRTGLRWFNAEGQPEGELAIDGATAVAFDRVEPGWLVAATGGIHHVPGPGHAARILAGSPGVVSRLGRSPSALYALVSDVFAVRGNEISCVHRFSDVWRSPSHSFWGFDAGPEGAYVSWQLHPGGEADVKRID